MYPSTRDWKWISALVFVLTWALASAVFAQAAAPQTPQTEEEKAKAAAEAAAKEQPVVSEEITVTSRLREESLQEVPFSIIAPTEEVLRSRGVETLEGHGAARPSTAKRTMHPTEANV